MRAQLADVFAKPHSAATAAFQHFGLRGRSPDVHDVGARDAAPCVTYTRVREAFRLRCVIVKHALIAVALAGAAATLAAVEAGRVQEWAFSSLDRVKVANGGRAELVTYRGRRALHLIVSPDHDAPTDTISATLAGVDFANGTIEADVAGAPRPGAPGDSRGFIGV